MLSMLLLAVAGTACGFLVGLLGIGGGIVFAPVLMYTFQRMGVPEDVIVPLTTGSSLFCVMLAAASGAWGYHKKQAVDARTALVVGLVSTVALYAVQQLVTMQPWYTPRFFSGVFAVVLLIVVYRMLNERAAGGGFMKKHQPLHLLGGIGLASGSLASAVGVGGGVILVPAFHRLLRFPMRLANGTSSATIVLTALVGTILYAADAAAPKMGPYVVGYVDFGHSLALALPAVATARVGVHVAHQINTRYLRWSFALLGLVVAARLIVDTI